MAARAVLVLFCVARALALTATLHNTNSTTNVTNDTQQVHIFNSTTMVHMQDIYDTTRGAQWGVRSGWNFTKRGSRYLCNPCVDRWRFVTCSADNQSITGLHMTNISLYLPSLPAGLFELTNLTELAIYNVNDTTGNMAPLSFTIPSSIGQLSRLKTLRMSMIFTPIKDSFGSHNLISRLQGSLPPAVGTLTSLVHLSLSMNSLQYSVPSALGKLMALKTLDLSGNALSGSVPSALSGLSSLTYLDLCKNSALVPASLPSYIMVLPSLVHMDLSCTRLFGYSIPTSLGNAKSLTFLSLSGSCGDDNNLMIKGTIPTQIATLKALRHLDLSQNSISGSIPTMLYKLTALTYLDLSGTSMTGPIPTQIGSMSRLVSLGLAASGPIPTQLGGLRALTRLSVVGDPFTGIFPTGTVPTELCSLSKLIELVINSRGPHYGDDDATSASISMPIHGAIPSQIGGLLGLTYLDLKSNMLNGSIPLELYSLTGLEWLDISVNQLSGTLSPAVGNLVSLSQFRAGSNSLTGSLPTQLGLCTNLQVLNLDGNKFTGAIPASLCIPASVCTPRPPSFSANLLHWATTSPAPRNASRTCLRHPHMCLHSIRFGNAMTLQQQAPRATSSRVFLPTARAPN